MSRTSMRIGIAGAGLCGRLLAWRFLRRGHQVWLYERDDQLSQSTSRAAGMAAAGMIAPFSEAVETGVESMRLGQGSLARWAVWLDELRNDGGGTVGFRNSGSLIVAHRQDMAELERFLLRLQRRIGTECRQELDRESLQKLEPELVHCFSRAIYLPEEGCLDNRALFTALQRVILRMGCTWRMGAEVSDIEPGRMKIGRQLYDFDLCVDCRGAGAIGQWAGLRGVRGEAIRVHAPEVSLSRPVRLLHPRYQLYIVPHSQSMYVVGATEIESSVEAPVTVRSALELFSALFSVHPGFAEAEICELNSACRPAFSDNLPRLESEQGLLRLNGLYRHGYLFVPQLIDLVEQDLLGAATGSSQGRPSFSDHDSAA